MNGIKASPGKWLVHEGTHRGTLTSRETSRHEYDSEEEARREYAKLKQQGDRMGLMVWFAHLYDDQGNRTILASGQPYER